MPQVWVQPRNKRACSPTGERLVLFACKDQEEDVPRLLTRFEVESRSLPSQCTFLKYLVDADVADKKVVVINRVLQVQPLPVLWKHVVIPREADAEGVTKRKPRRKHAASPQSHVKDAQAIPSAVRPQFEAALQKDPAFYSLLVYYNDDALLKLTPSQRETMMSVKDTSMIHSWAAMRINLDLSIPCMGALRSRISSGFTHLDLYETLWKAYSLTGSTWYPGLPEDEKVANLRAMNLLTDNNAFADVVDAEAKLLELATQKQVEVHVWRSWHVDFLSFALQLATKQGATVIVPDDQTREDCIASDLRDVLPWHAAAYGNPGGGPIVALRAERFTLKELTDLLQNLGQKQKLILMGDDVLKLVIPERASPLHGFALLASAQEPEVHDWPRKLWQRGIHEEVNTGIITHANTSILEKWESLKDAIPQKQKQCCVVLCFHEDDRLKAMDALSTHSNAISDMPRPNAVYSVPSLGYVGRIKRVFPSPPKYPRGVEFNSGDTDTFTVAASEVRRNYVECLSRYLGTKHELVILLIRDDTPRDQIACALKYAVKTLRILFTPETQTRRFSNLPASAPYNRSANVR